MRTVVLVALAIGLLVAWCDADLEATAEEAAATDDDSQLTEEEDLKNSIALCRVLGMETKELFPLRSQLDLEEKVTQMAHKLILHLNETHGAWLEGHKSWTCAQAREAMKHEHVTNFLDGFDRWYSTAPVSLERTLKLVENLQNALAASDLLHERSSAEFADLKHDLEAVKSWHVALRDHYSEMMHEANSRNCEVPFQKFMTTLAEIQREQIPEWYNLAEGLAAMWENCLNDVEIKASLGSMADDP